MAGAKVVGSASENNQSDDNSQSHKDGFEGAFIRFSEIWGAGAGGVNFHWFG